MLSFTDNQTDHVTGRTPMERFAMNAATSTETAMAMTEDVKQNIERQLNLSSTMSALQLSHGKKDIAFTTGMTSPLSGGAMN